MPTSYSLIQNDISPDEGDRMSFTVLRSGDLPGEILYFSTLSGTASFGNGDYEMPGGGEPREVAFFIGAGQSTLNISLDILDDGLADAGQTFRAIVETRPASTFVEVARSATITIQEPVQNTTYDISPNVTSVTEGNQVTFTITRTGDRPAETVYFSTLSDGTATYGEGDYRLESGGAPADVAVSFGSGVASRTVTLDILSGDGADSPESFRAIVQRSSSDGVSAYLDRSSYVTINEVPQAANQDPTASGTNRTVAAGESIALSSLFSYSDSDGSVVSFTVTDATSGGGRFVNNGVNQATSGTWGQAPNEIPISQIGNWSFVAGSAGSVDNLRFTATDDDGGYNRTAATATVTVQAAANQDPTASGTNRTVAAGESIALSDLFSFSDSDGSVVSFTVTDATSGGGRFVNNGVNQTTFGTFGQSPNEIPISEIGDWSFVAGSAGSVDNLRFTATDDDGGYNRTAANATVTVQANQDPTASALTVAQTFASSLSFVSGASGRLLSDIDLYRAVPGETLIIDAGQTPDGLDRGFVLHDFDLELDPEAVRLQHGLEFLDGPVGEFADGLGTGLSFGIVGANGVYMAQDGLSLEDASDLSEQTAVASLEVIAETIGMRLLFVPNPYAIAAGATIILIVAATDVIGDVTSSVVDWLQELSSPAINTVANAISSGAEYTFGLIADGLEWLAEDDQPFGPSIDGAHAQSTALFNFGASDWADDLSTNTNNEPVYFGIPSGNEDIAISTDVTGGSFTTVNANSPVRITSVSDGGADSVLAIEDIEILRLYASRYSDTFEIGTFSSTSTSVQEVHISAGSGNDIVDGSEANRELIVAGGDGNDRVLGGTGNDELAGGSGDDVIVSSFGDNRIFGDENDDMLAAHSGSNVIFSGEDDDLAVGGIGADIIYGANGNDVLVGDISSVLFGRDAIIGGFGNDLMSGGGGADTFVFRPAEGTDIIGSLDVDYDTLSQTTVVGRDFQTAIDVLDMRDFGYTDASQALANISDQAGHATFVDQGTTIILFDVSTSDLSSDNFIFG
jgi:Ca2+-binding RTX toxin-like protein